MPIRKHDPFVDPLAGLSSDVNPYLEMLRAGAAGALPLLYGPSLAPCPGRWREHFAQRMTEPPRSLVLEIGSHLGEVILQMARQHPETAFVGLDITFKRVVKVAQKAQQADLKNLISVLANAKGIDSLFAPQELDGVLIFFPDPWAKKQRQSKNRLIEAEFLRCLSTKMRAEAFLWFKTDCLPYYEEVLAHLKSAGWRLGETPEGIPSESYVSRFQRLFEAQGQSTHELIARPPQPPQVLC